MISKTEYKQIPEIIEIIKDGALVDHEQMLEAFEVPWDFTMIVNKIAVLPPQNPYRFGPGPIILIHVKNHCHYRRANLAKLVKQADAEGQVVIQSTEVNLARIKEF